MSFSKEHWDSLISSPGWDAMKGYLMDARTNIMEQMADGKIKPDIYPEAVARCQNLKDLADMDWATIAKFYGIKIEEPKETV